MFEVSQICNGEFEIKGSRFLSYLIPFSYFSNHLIYLKGIHPKAVHFVYASRWIEGQIKESFSDDGEPKGSSGIPTLNVLRGERLINVGLVSVRYFGGTLLGVGGLLRAYTHSAQKAILEAKNCGALRPYYNKIVWKCNVSYKMLNRCLYLAKKYGIEILNKEFLTDKVVVEMSAALENKEEFEVAWN